MNSDQEMRMLHPSVSVEHLILAYSILISNYFRKQEKLTETYVLILDTVKVVIFGRVIFRASAIFDVFACF